MPTGLVIVLCFVAGLLLVPIYVSVRNLFQGVYYKGHAYRILRKKDDKGRIHYQVVRALVVFPMTEWYTGIAASNRRWSVYEDGHPGSYNTSASAPAKRFDSQEEAGEQLSNLIDQTTVVRITTESL